MRRILKEPTALVLRLACGNLLRSDTPTRDRMPVILDPREYGRWLDPSGQKPALLELLRPCPGEWLTANPVSTSVNSSRHDGPECVQPLGQPVLARAVLPPVDNCPKTLRISVKTA
jgi:hypothetical protein